GAGPAELPARRRRGANLLGPPKPPDPATLKQRDEALAGYARQMEALDRELRPLLPSLERADGRAQATPADLQQVLPADAAVVDFPRWTLFGQYPKVPGRNRDKTTLP